ncbi:putative T7SS-secreted protein [Kitasatospora sp. NPDC048365]|uniref:putative T7SS-secreted protein n=1 Tax=Kitasatospora sp. NPDC048365 TaxID=3364050 RepID=UPI003712B7E8
MGLLDSIGEGISDAWDSGKKAVGGFVDANAHILGDGLDMIGLDDAAHAVDKWGDEFADSMGAQVGELGLGQTDDPTELVHGDVKTIGENVGHLKKFGTAFEETGSGLTRLDHEHWQGEAADAFRSKFAPQPGMWLAAADACAGAGRALETYAQTVTWAQDQAKQAIEAYNAAKKASEDARNAYQREVDWYNQEAKAWNDYARSGNDPGPPPPMPKEFRDPGVEGAKQAAEILRSARKQRDEAGRTAAQAIRAITGHAPAKPSFTQRLEAGIQDAGDFVAVGYLHLEGGIVKGAADLVKFARGLNPMDPYNLTHPAQYMDHVSTTLAGLVTTANHPVELGKALVGSGWGSDPFEAGGKFIFNVGSGMLTGGGSEAAVVAERMGIGAAERTAVSAAERTAINAGEHAAINAGESAAINAGEHAAINAGEQAAVNAGEHAAVNAGEQAAVQGVEHAGENAVVGAHPGVSPTNPAGLPEGWTVKSPWEGGADQTAGVAHPVPEPTPHATPAPTEPTGFHPAEHGSGDAASYVHGDDVAPAGQPHGHAPEPTGHTPEPAGHTPETQPAHVPEEPTTGHHAPEEHQPGHTPEEHQPGHGADEPAGQSEHGSSEHGTSEHGTSEHGSSEHGTSDGQSGHSGDSDAGHGKHMSDDDWTALSKDQQMQVAEDEISGGARKFADNDEAMRYGADHWNSKLDEIAPEDRSAVRDYTYENAADNGGKPCYKEINGALRSDGPVPDDIAQHVDAMDRALKSNPIPEDVMVTRGTDLGHIKMDPADMAGQVFDEKSYTSASLGGPAGAFAGKDAVLHLRVPAGTPALWVEKVSAFGVGEREILLGRGLQWRATRVVQEGGQWHVYGEVL